MNSAWIWMLMVAPGITDMDVENRATPVFDTPSTKEVCLLNQIVVEQYDMASHYWCESI